MEIPTIDPELSPAVINEHVTKLPRKLYELFASVETSLKGADIEAENPAIAGLSLAITLEIAGKLGGKSIYLPTGEKLKAGILEARIMNAHNEGSPVIEIAAKLGLDESTVNKAIRLAKKRKAGLKKKRPTREQLARRGARKIPVY